MQVTAPNLNIFFTSVENRFWTAYNAAPAWIDRIASTYPVATEQWVSGWIGMLKSYREWKGPRVTSQPAPQTYLVQIQKFEKTESVERTKIEDDTYGLYNPTIDFFGIQARKWPDYQMRDLLQNAGSQTGTRQLGLDGLTHWNTAHPVNLYDASFGTFANDFRGGGVTVNGTLVGGAVSAKSVSTLWQEIASRKSENGEALGLLADLIMCAPQRSYDLRTILQAQFLGAPQIGNIGSGTGANGTLVGTSDNMLRGLTDLLVNPDLGLKPDEWYMLVGNTPIKPFSWLLRSAPDMVFRVRPDDPIVFDMDKYVYGSRARGAPAWGFAWLSAISGP